MTAHAQHAGAAPFVFREYYATYGGLELPKTIEYIDKYLALGRR